MDSVTFAILIKKLFIERMREEISSSDPERLSTSELAFHTKVMKYRMILWRIYSVLIPMLTNNSVSSTLSPLV